MKLGFTVEYDGTTYSGFQSQKNVLTVQGCIENALKKVTKEDIRINYSGRTDAGVHAISQVCDFETNIDRNKKNWLNGLNSNLPGSIAVKDIFEVPADFNSRFSAIERKYAYLIYNSDNKPLFFEKHAHWITNKLNTVIMEEELKKFIGKKDFSSFRSSNCNSNNAIKTVNDVSLKTINNFIIITIVANAFLQNMVRIMVGTLIDIAKKENSMSIEEILDKKNRSFAGKTAPACGLFFLGPSYKDELKIKSCEKSIIERLKI